MDKYDKIRFLNQQKRDIFKELGDPIQLDLWKLYRKKMKVLNELINAEKHK